MIEAAETRREVAQSTDKRLEAEHSYDQPTMFGQSARSVPRLVAFGIAGLWAILLPLTMVLQPATDTPPDTFATIVSLAFTLALLGTVAGLAVRAPFGLAASAIGGGVMLFAGATCLLTGHNGAWIFVQMGAGAALAATSAAALRSV